MKTLVLLLLSLLGAGALRAAAPTLTPEQVKAIAALVVMKEHKNADPISNPHFDEKTGIWSCMTLNGAVHASILIDVRDQDRHARTTRDPFSMSRFRIHTSLRRKIDKIAPLPKSAPVSTPRRSRG